MELRNGANKPGEHLSRQGVALGFAERLIVDGDNDHPRRRPSRAGQKEPQVESEIFDPVQTGGDANCVIEAKPSARHQRSRDETAGEQP